MLELLALGELAALIMLEMWSLLQGVCQQGVLDK
jgi:hypothetical protein